MSTNTSKKTKIRIVVLIAQCAAFILLYVISFFGNPLFFLILVIGSVAVLSTVTIYTVIHNESTADKITEKNILYRKQGRLKREKS